jgi:hypothetical protein
MLARLIRAALGVVGLEAVRVPGRERIEGDMKPLERNRFAVEGEASRGAVKATIADTSS